MMKKTILLIVLFATVISANNTFGQKTKKTKKEINSKVDTRIDNMTYWREMAKKGYVPVAPYKEVEKAVFKGSQIISKSVLTEDSPDVPVNDDGDNTQSENSIFVNPSDNSKVLNSNNSTQWFGGTVGTLYGANYFYSEDEGVTWGGSTQGAGGSNSGDPATAISLDGSRHYVGFIHDNYGQGVSYSTDGGNTWTSVQAGINTGSMLDKNHLWIDNSPSSPYEGNVYDAWTDFGGSMDNEIGFVRSTDGGLSYSSAVNLSSAVNAGSHNQGVNLNSGPNGEVYAVWAIYDDWYGAGYEEAFGFAKSVDGGASFAPATRIIENLKGIRGLDPKNHRVNSFPVMSVDISGGIYNGNIYVVWANIGDPGVNSGTNVSSYIIKSTDGGDTWSSPIRINQGTFENGKYSYFPWITCDPETGTLSVIFYDDRNVSSLQAETWVANSYDGGDTWEDFRISDVAFTPDAIPGLAGGYMGDYLGISARGGVVYPVWADNRNGYVQTFTSPFMTNNRARPTNLIASITNENIGYTNLAWDYNENKTLQHFVIYRDNVQIGTTMQTSFYDILPDYGYYTYKVTAMHEDGESSPVSANLTWGTVMIYVDPTSLSEVLQTNQTSVKVLTIHNLGQLDLIYNLNTQITSKKSPKVYCSASGGGDEYISGVEFGDISNTGTNASGYSDYTSMSTMVDAGNTYPVTITNGNVWVEDDLGIWIDWNQDGDFDDLDENVVCETGNSGQGTYNIFVPDNATAGETRMRVRIKYFDDNCGDACGSTSYGEVEDYTVVVNSWLLVESNEGTVLPGNSENINVNFNSEGLAAGTYTGVITIGSNDSQNPEINVPVTLLVSGTSNIENTSFKSETTIYPNPSDGAFSLNVNNDSVINVKVINGLGVIVYKNSFTQNLSTLDLSHLSNGIYFMQISSENESVVERIVIQK